MQAGRVIRYIFCGSKGPQKDAAATPHAICRSEIGSLNGILSPFPCIPTSSITGKALREKGLGHNFKDSDFHSTCPLVPEKIWEVNKLYFGSVQAFPISIFKVKSALNPTSR